MSDEAIELRKRVAELESKTISDNELMKKKITEHSAMQKKIEQ